MRHGLRNVYRPHPAGPPGSGGLVQNLQLLDQGQQLFWLICAAVCKLQKRGLPCCEHLLTAVHHVQVRVLAQLPQLQRGINRQQKILSSLPQR